MSTSSSSSLQGSERLEQQVRVASATEMAHLIHTAKTQGYNRQITEEVIPELDGYSLVIPFMIHEHKAGKVTNPHWRCQVLLRFGDDPSLPHEGWLDVDMDQFKVLRTVKQIREEQSKENITVQVEATGKSTTK